MHHTSKALALSAFAPGKLYQSQFLDGCCVIKVNGPSGKEAGSDG